MQWLPKELQPKNKSAYYMDTIRLHPLAHGGASVVLAWHLLTVDSVCPTSRGDVPRYIVYSIDDTTEKISMALASQE